MQITPHFLDKDAGRTANVSHGRIHETNHEALIIAAGSRGVAAPGDPVVGCFEFRVLSKLL